MKHNILIALILVISISGCAATVKPLTTPSGKQGFVVSCDGSADNWSTCYEAATKACQGTYVMVDRQQHSTATPYGPLVTRNLIIECGRL
jgi:uncharacterized protein YceK